MQSRKLDIFPNIWHLITLDVFLFNRLGYPTPMEFDFLWQPRSTLLILMQKTSENFWSNDRKLTVLLFATRFGYIWMLWFWENLVEFMVLAPGEKFWSSKFSEYQSSKLTVMRQVFLTLLKVSTIWFRRDIWNIHFEICLIQWTWTVGILNSKLPNWRWKGLLLLDKLCGKRFCPLSLFLYRNESSVKKN